MLFAPFTKFLLMHLLLDQPARNHLGELPYLRRPPHHKHQALAPLHLLSRLGQQPPRLRYPRLLVLNQFLRQPQPACLNLPRHFQQHGRQILVIV